MSAPPRRAPLSAHRELINLAELTFPPALEDSCSPTMTARKTATSSKSTSQNGAGTMVSSLDREAGRGIASRALACVPVILMPSREGAGGVLLAARAAVTSRPGSRALGTVSLQRAPLRLRDVTPRVEESRFPKNVLVLVEPVGRCPWWERSLRRRHDTLKTLKWGACLGLSGRVPSGATGGP